MPQNQYQLYNNQESRLKTTTSFIFHVPSDKTTDLTNVYCKNDPHW